MNVMWAFLFGSYRRKFGGLVLGLGPRVRFHFSDGYSGPVKGPGAAIDDSQQQKQRRYWTAIHARREKDPEVRRLVMAPLVSIKVPSTPSLPLGALLVPLTDLKPTGPSIQEESSTDQVQRRMKTFNEQLRSRPHDVSLWLSFISFQDEAFNAEGGSKMAVILLDRKLVSLATIACTADHNS
jgi:hypothetical protein